MTREQIKTLIALAAAFDGAAQGHAHGLGVHDCTPRDLRLAIEEGGVVGNPFDSRGRTIYTVIAGALTFYGHEPPLESL